MSTEVCSASARVSFSQGILAPSAAAGECQRKDGSLPVEQGAGDFKFSIDLQISADGSSTADELFSGGKMLPFFKTPSLAEIKPAPLPRPNLDRPRSLHTPSESAVGSGDDSASAGGDLRGSGRRSFWRFGRSSSVGSVVEPASIFPFSLYRSKSTGSFPNPRRPRQQTPGNTLPSSKLRSDSNHRKTYYFSASQRSYHGGGVRISPVLNVPAPIVTTNVSGSGASSSAITGIFNYLLCNCGGEEKCDGIGRELSISQHNGMGSFNFRR